MKYCFIYNVSMNTCIDTLKQLETMTGTALDQLAAVDPHTMPDLKPLTASLRRLASVLSDIERAKVREPGQRGRPSIHHDDPAERERYRQYLLDGMGSREIEKSGREPYSRDTINEKLKRYSEELGIERKTRFGKGRKWAI